MHILHITTFLQGGAGCAITDLALNQAATGHDVTVVTSRRGEEDYGNYPQWLEKLSAAGIDVLQVDSTFKRDVALHISAFRHLRETLAGRELSLIHTHAAIPSMLALLLRSNTRRNAPILQTMHGWGIRKDALQAATDIALMSAVDVVVTPSAASKRLLERLGVRSDHMSIVPYGVGPLRLSAEPPELDLLRRWRSSGYTVLVCIGTVGSRKNQRLLIEAIADSKAPVRLACAIVGEGEDVPKLRAMVQQTGIEARVHFFGYQPDAARFLDAADWLVLPSNDEGLPLSILEAYRAGVPVIGSDIPEIAEVVVPRETGILFRAGNRESLVEALSLAAHLPDDMRSRMASSSTKLWKQRYSLERMVSGYAELYENLVKSPCALKLTAVPNEARRGCS